MSAPSGRSLDRGTRWLLATMAGATTAGAIASVFVNLFIFVVSHQLRALALFNGVYFLTLNGVFYLVAAAFARHAPIRPYRLGLFLTAGFYGVLWFLGSAANRHLVGLGILQGVAQGFFWFGANLMTFDTVDPAQRIRFYGINSAVSSVAGVLGPLAGGLIIGFLPHFEGYLLVFSAAVVLYGVTFGISLAVPPGPALGNMPLRVSFQLARRFPLWRDALKTLAVRGTREAMTGLAGVFLVYLATRSAWLVGVYSSVSAVMRMVGSLAVARWVTPEKRGRSLWIGVVGMSLGALALFGLRAGAWAVFLYGIVMSVSMPWFTVPNEAIPLDVMDQDPDVTRHRVGYMLSRELALNSGRLASMGLLMVLYQKWPHPMTLVIFVLLASMAQGYVAWTGQRIWRRLHARVSPAFAEVPSPR